MGGRDCCVTYEPRLLPSPLVGLLLRQQTLLPPGDSRDRSHFPYLRLAIQSESLRSPAVRKNDTTEVPDECTIAMSEQTEVCKPHKMHYDLPHECFYLQWSGVSRVLGNNECTPRMSAWDTASPVGLRIGRSFSGSRRPYAHMWPFWSVSKP